VQRLFDASQAVLRDPDLVKRILASGNEVALVYVQLQPAGYPAGNLHATWALEDGVRQAKLALEAGAAAGQ
jgi:hypothetical protein